MIYFKSQNRPGLDQPSLEAFVAARQLARERGELPTATYTQRPPSTSSATPVMKSASSETR